MYFFQSKFYESASFIDTLFNGETEFSGANFDGKVDFLRAKFNFPVDFSDATFGIEAYFSKTRFGAKAEFVGTRFNGRTYFFSSTFEDIGVFSRTQFADSAFFSLSPRQVTAPRIMFENVLMDRPERIKFENFNFGKTTFMGTNLRSITFHNPQWTHFSPWSTWLNLSYQSILGTRIVLNDETCGYLEKNPEALRILYRDLKANFEDAKDYSDAGDFYYSEMEIRRKILRINESRIWRFFRRFLSPYTLYWLVCGYGERPLRALMVFIFLLFGFASIYSFSQRQFIYDAGTAGPAMVKYFKGPVDLNFRDSIEYSLRSLTLQHSEHIKPHSDDALARRLTLTENILGPLQLGLFFLAMRRRFRR